MPNAAHTLPQRSPNFPPRATSAFRPGGQQPTIADSIAEVPDPVIVSTVPLVWNTY